MLLICCFLKWFYNVLVFHYYYYALCFLTEGRVLSNIYLFVSVSTMCYPGAQYILSWSCYWTKTWGKSWPKTRIIEIPKMGLYCLTTTLNVVFFFFGFLFKFNALGSNWQISLFSFLCVSKKRWKSTHKSLDKLRWCIDWCFMSLKNQKFPLSSRIHQCLFKLTDVYIYA